MREGREMQRLGRSRWREGRRERNGWRDLQMQKISEWSGVRREGRSKRFVKVSESWWKGSREGEGGNC